MIGGIIGFLFIIIILSLVLDLSFRILKFLFGTILILIILAFLMAEPASAYEYTPEEMVMIGKIVQHECPHESEMGQRLVIDTILNRVECDAFPNTVKGVLNQPGQYCNPTKYPKDGVYKLIAQEIYSRTNNQIFWYKTGGYHKYGNPIIKEGSHYFSGGM